MVYSPVTMMNNTGKSISLYCLYRSLLPVAFNTKQRALVLLSPELHFCGVSRENSALEISLHIQELQVIMAIFTGYYGYFDCYDS